MNFRKSAIRALAGRFVAVGLGLMVLLASCSKKVEVPPAYPETPASSSTVWDVSS